MNKYIELEGAIKKIEERMLPDFRGKVRTILSDLPTIEVSEDCISREDAVNALIAHFIPQTYTGEEVEQAIKLAREIISNAPSVVPTTEQSSLVRCKDCKWLGVQNEPEGTCYYWCRNIGAGFAVDEWNYCCWGERKEE